MFIVKSKWLALAALAVAGGGFVQAQDSGPLINMLIKKGIVTDQEADDLRADLAKDNMAGLATTSKSNNLDKVTLTGRFQSQFADLNTDAGDTVAKPSYTQHFFLRRIYVGVKALFAANWSGTLNYDFAGTTFDAAFIEWAPSPMLIVDTGFRKVPFGYDEWSISSGALKSIERSPVTRFFVEANNGRRLGAGSYRQGIFVGGASANPVGGFSYNLAATDPERDESAAGVAAVGSNTNNNFAYWSNLGFNHKFGDGLLNSWKIGASAGLLPDQGGPTNANLGKGFDLSVYSVYADLYYNNVSLVAEYYGSKNDSGISLTQDSKSSGYWVQPSIRFGAYEPVVRFTHVDSDGRGVVPGDLVRSAPNPAGLTFDKLDEWFVGFNWYLLGNDLKHEVKLQAGYISSTSTDRLTGAATVEKLRTDGFRSQLQVNF